MPRQCCRTRLLSLDLLSIARSSGAVKLTDEQKQTIADWADEDEINLGVVQKRLKSELGIAVTYLETRFLLEDHGIELKMFLNEEIPRLKNIVKNSLNLKEIKNDSEMLEKTKEIIKILETTSKRVLDNKFVHEILKIQSLVKELA